MIVTGEASGEGNSIFQETQTATNDSNDAAANRHMAD